jgi:hypothetical protein
VRAVLRHPAVGVLLVYLFGVGLRVDYTLYRHRPEAYVSSDMSMYVSLAKRLGTSPEPLKPWDVTHPLGYPALLSVLLGHGGSFARATNVQLAVSCLLPLALGLLGAAAFGRRTALAAVAVASVYFPFIEYGALFLSEIHFIFFLTLAFAAFLAAIGAARRGVALALAAAGGLALSIAASLKSVALPAAVAFFGWEAIALALDRDPARPSLAGRLRPWLARAALAAVAASPLLALLARVCTRANEGRFCVTGNKVGSDFLLGHYGRIADMAWAPEHGVWFQFGSPSAFLHHYSQTARVSFPMTDNAANTAEAWRWIFAHPVDAIVLSLEHVYDTFFGGAMWPTFNDQFWPAAYVAQYAFVAFLFIPTVLACRAILSAGLRAGLWPGLRAFAVSRTALLLAPIAALVFTVAVATGEVRYRVPFDIFFIVIACGFVVGDLRRRDVPVSPPEPAPAP